MDDPRADVAAADMLQRPSGTTLRLLLLIAMVALSAAFIGNWMFLSLDDEVLAPWPWLALPPIVVLAVAAALTWLAGEWLERRHGWVPVPADRGTAALARVDALAAEAGLRETPRLLWSPGEDRTRALAYGRPGDHRLVVSPVLVGAARRRPAAFDAVLRHELAHVRHRDVAPAYFAVVVWYVLLAALCVPLLWRVVDRDLSLVPDYLVRVALLALVVAWVRADLLRTREGYADLRASLTAEHRRDLLAGLEAAPPTRPRRLRHPFSLHPTPAARAALVRDPSRHGRLHAGELFAVGLTASWSVPLLGELLDGVGLDALRAEDATRLLVFGLVGAYVAAAAIRGAGGASARPGALAPAALGVGLALGPAVSIGSTGLLERAPGELLGAAVTAAAVTAYAVWLSDLSLVLTGSGRAWSRARDLFVIAVGAAVLALTASAVLPVAEALRLGADRLVTDDPVRALASTTASLVLAVLVPAVSLVSLLIRAPLRTLAACLAGLVLGGVSTLVVLGVRLRADLPDDAATLRYYLAAVLISAGGAALAAVLLASWPGPPALLGAATAAATAVLAAAVGWVVMEDLAFGSTLGVVDLRGFLREAGPTAALLAVVPAALARFVGSPGPATPRRRWVVGEALVALVAGALTVALVPPVVEGTAAERPAVVSELREYVTIDVPALLERRDAAFAAVQQAMLLDPSLAPAALDAAVDQYDELIVDVDDQALVSSQAGTVRADLGSSLRAERDLIEVEQGVLTGLVGGDDYLAAVERADRAAFTFAMTYQEAREEVSGQ